MKEPTQDLDVPFEAIREEEQDDFEEQEDCDNCDDPTPFPFTVFTFGLAVSPSRSLGGVSLKV